MQRIFLPIILFAWASCASAAPLGDADTAKLAGEWRAQPASGDACSGPKGAPRFMLEFAMTGGQAFIEDAQAGRLMLGVKSVDASGDALSVSFQTGSSWSFTRAGKDTLISQAPPDRYAALKGLTFHHCRPPADRSTLKIGKDAVNYFSVMMPPDYPTFIDAHEKDGCKAKSYRYLSIDLVGPEDFAVTSGTLRRTPPGSAVPVRLDDAKTWSIDAADELPSVVRLTITPLTGPDHVRGTPTRISLIPDGEGNLLTIPEWDAVYRRCGIRDLAD
jgi:hypothetical protein